ncbi:hypothetical protein D3C80_1336420 [compost metagenome]
MSTTDPPLQKVVDPPAVIVGAEGPAVTETTNEFELLEHQLLQEEEVVVKYVPDVVALIACVVSPFGSQSYHKAGVEVSVTEFPLQKASGPPAVIFGVLLK